MLGAAACAPPAPPPAAARAPVLYVANARDGTIARLDGRTGRPVGLPVPSGGAPMRLVQGEDGSLLVASSGAGAPAPLTRLAPRATGWEARRLPLGPGARVTHLAGDGGPVAAVAYALPEDRLGAAPACRVALVDTVHGTARPLPSACAPGEALTGLAVGTDSAGTLVYLALWPAWPGGAPGAAGRVVALDAARGTMVAVQPVPGVPGDLTLAPAPDAAGRHLYATMAAADDGSAAYPHDPGALYDRGPGWRLLRLHPATLAPEGEHALPWAGYGLTVAPDGRDAYAYAGAGGLLWEAALVRLDLTTGEAALLHPVPGAWTGGLAATADRLYVPDAVGDAVWVADRRGRYLTTLPVGRHPLAVLAGVGRG
jgi:hypothetical protein